MKSILLIIISLLSTIAVAQPIDWQVSLGGSLADVANSVVETSDGGYIVAGYTYSSDGDITTNNGDKDYWIVKLTSTGAVSWEKTYGGSSEDEAKFIQQTTDGGYIVAGFTYSNDGDVTGNHGQIDFWVIKLNSTGNIIWQKALGGTAFDLAYCIKQTSDGGYIVAGQSYSSDGDVTNSSGAGDYWIVKLNSTGSITWEETYGGTSNETAHTVEQTTDGGYILAGYTTSTNGDITGNNGTWDYWVVKITSTGVLSWQKCLGGSGMDIGNSITQTTTGEYVVVGYTESNDGDVTNYVGGGDNWAVKLTSTGSIIWEKVLGGSGAEMGTRVKQTTDGDFIIVGYTESNVGGNFGQGEVWLVKLTSSGSVSWQESFGGTNLDQGNAIQQTADGGYIVAGVSESIDGDLTNNNGSSDFWVIKLSPTVSIEESSIESQLSVSPNPTTGIVTISLEEATNSILYLHNSLGQIVLSISIEDTDNVTLDLSHVPSGIYFLQLDVDGRTFTKKIIKH